MKTEEADNAAVAEKVARTQPDAQEALREAREMVGIAEVELYGRKNHHLMRSGAWFAQVGKLIDSALTTDEEGERRSGEERRKAPAGPYGGPRGGRRLRTRRAADRTPSTTDEPTGKADVR